MKTLLLFALVFGIGIMASDGHAQLSSDVLVRPFQPGIPFKSGPNTIGFKPEVKARAFTSINEFIVSVQKDEPAHFRDRLSRTDTKLVNDWIAYLQQKNPKLLPYVNAKLIAARKIGFDRKEESIVGFPTATNPIGFKPIAKPVGFATYELLNRALQLVNLNSPEQILDFQQRLRLTNPKELERNGVILQKRNPRFYKAVHKESKRLEQKLSYIVHATVTIGFKPEIRVNAAPAPVPNKIGF